MNLSELRLAVAEMCPILWRFKNREIEDLKQQVEAERLRSEILLAELEATRRKTSLAFDGWHIVRGSEVWEMQTPRKYYTYGWLDGVDLFYVGKGKGRRAWANHLSTDNKGSAKCQVRWDSCDNPGVIIFVDNLTAKGATIIESLLIKLHEPSTNHNGNPRRQLSWGEVVKQPLVGLPKMPVRFSYDDF